MKTTIKDIAAMAGVSISTVSRALNNKGGMEEQTRERILDISKRLDYRPSAFARGLVLQRSKTLMVLVPDLANYFFAEVVQEISTVCRERGYKVLLGSTVNQPELEHEYLDTIRENAVDGAILVPQNGQENLNNFLDLARAEFPLVLIDRAFDYLRMNSVLVDNIGGAKTVVDYLHGKGHRKIALICGDIERVHASRDRYRGFLEGLAAKGLDINNEYIITHRPSPDRGGIEAMAQLLKLEEPPTAVFADSDATACGCIGVIHRHGRRVPEDVAVVGFDNLNFSAYYDVPLTTMAQPKREIAEKSVDMVIGAIRRDPREDSSAVQEVLLRPELVVRDSA